MIVDGNRPENRKQRLGSSSPFVGDVAGMGADLFGSLAESTCAALVISSQSHHLVEEGWACLMVPLTISALGIIVCAVASFLATDIYPVRKEVSRRAGTYPNFSVTWQTGTGQ